MSIQQHPASPANYTAGRRAPISMVVIHVMEGGFGPTAAWFANPDAKACAHYGISVDGTVAQYVADSDTAWHAGNGDVNAASIGIELEGHCDDPQAFTEHMMDALAGLILDLAARYQIPLDRQHVIGHSEVPDPRHPGQLGGAGHHHDPGEHFPWFALMDRIEQPVS